MSGEERQKIIMGTKCVECCDCSWCWNALKENYRDLCAGPFKDFADFVKRTKGELVK
jgi:hypothetical protein